MRWLYKIFVCLCFLFSFAIGGLFILHGRVQREILALAKKQGLEVRVEGWLSTKVLLDRTAFEQGSYEVELSRVEVNFMRFPISLSPYYLGKLRLKSVECGRCNVRPLSEGKYSEGERAPLSLRKLLQERLPPIDSVNLPFRKIHSFKIETVKYLSYNISNITGSFVDQEVRGTFDVGREQWSFVGSHNFPHSRLYIGWKRGKNDSLAGGLLKATWVKEQEKQRYGVSFHLSTEGTLGLQGMRHFGDKLGKLSKLGKYLPSNGASPFTWTGSVEGKVPLGEALHESEEVCSLHKVRFEVPSYVFSGSGSILEGVDEESTSPRVSILGEISEKGESLQESMAGALRIGVDAVCGEDRARLAFTQIPKSFLGEFENTKCVVESTLSKPNLSVSILTNVYGAAVEGEGFFSLDRDKVVGRCSVRSSGCDLKGNLDIQLFPLLIRDIALSGRGKGWFLSTICSSLFSGDSWFGAVLGDVDFSMKKTSLSGSNLGRKEIHQAGDPVGDDGEIHICVLADSYASPSVYLENIQQQAVLSGDLSLKRGSLSSDVIRMVNRCQIDDAQFSAETTGDKIEFSSSLAGEYLELYLKGNYDKKSSSLTICALDGRAGYHPLHLERGITWKRGSSFPDQTLFLRLGQGLFVMDPGDTPRIDAHSIPLEPLILFLQPFSNTLSHMGARGVISGSWGLKQSDPVSWFPWWVHGAGEVKGLDVFDQNETLLTLETSQCSIIYNQDFLFVEGLCQNEGQILTQGKLLLPLQEGQIAQLRPMEGEVLIECETSLFHSLFQHFGFSLGGTVKGDLRLGGVPKTPSLAGHLSLDKGFLSKKGLMLDQIQLRILGKGKTIEVELRNDASNPGSSTLNGTGRVHVAPYFPFQAQLSLHRFPIQEEIGTFLMTGPLTLQGNSQAVSVRGDLKVDEGRIVISDNEEQQAKSVPHIPVRWKSRGHADSSPAEMPNKEDQSSLAELGIQVHCPSTLQMAGSEMDSLWAGQFFLSGPPSALQCVGQLDLCKGTIFFAKHEFPIQEGTVTMKGNLAQTQIHLSSVRSISGLDVHILCEGKAFAPRVVISSIPALSKRSIISHLLFEKDIAEINQSQLLEVIQTAIGSKSPLSKIQDMLGVQFSFFEDSDSQWKVKLEKTLTNKMSVGLIKAIHTPEAHYTLEYQILKGVSLRLGGFNAVSQIFPESNSNIAYQGSLGFDFSF